MAADKRQFTFIFALGTIFTFLDAWNIGANDVANAWASSVGSRSVTYLQAMALGAIMEFAGSLTAGSRVSDTIRSKIVDPTLFTNDKSVLMLGMFCAIIGSAFFLTIANKLGFPVSTTHTTIGGLLGMGIASVGAENITWIGRENGKVKLTSGSGVVPVFLAWVISPALAGGFASIIFLVTKYGILLRRNPITFAFYSVPFYFGVTASLLCMLVVTKGGGMEMGNGRITTVVVVVSGVVFGLLATFFLLPWIYRMIIVNDWQLRWFHVFLGPLVLRRGHIPPPPAGHQIIRDFYEGHYTRDEAEAYVGSVIDVEPKHQNFIKSLVGPKPEGGIFSVPLLVWYVKWLLLRGVDQDVVLIQEEDSILSGDLEDTHSRVQRYDNKVEYIFVLLQVITAMAFSFTHAANDVANSIAPFATVYEIWDKGKILNDVDTLILSRDLSKILVFGGTGIVLGLWTYGYHNMKNLGNRLTLHSPSRGFSIELGSAITIILATKFAFPVSTTQCITGATVGVGLCNGSWRAINWRMVAWIYLGWIITLPVAGICSGCLMGFVINAPRFQTL